MSGYRGFNRREQLASLLLIACGLGSFILATALVVTLIEWAVR